MKCRTVCIVAMLVAGCAVEAERVPVPRAAGGEVQPYGAECSDAAQCASGTCVDGLCTVSCSLAQSVDACGHVNAFCDGTVCVGAIETGEDGDAARLGLGDAGAFYVDGPDDVDLFLLEVLHPVPAELLVETYGVDVQLELYDLGGIGRAEYDGGGVNEAERIRFDGSAPVHRYLAVRNVGGTVGSYELSVRAPQF